MKGRGTWKVQYTWETRYRNMKYKIIIPDTPTSLNKLDSMHWGARRRIKQRFGVAVLCGVAASGVPVGFQDPPQKVHIDVTIYAGGGRGRLPDGDNMLKHLFDLLRANQVIHDDSQKWLSWSQPVIKRDKTNPRTEVVVNDEVDIS